MSEQANNEKQGGAKKPRGYYVDYRGKGQSRRDGFSRRHGNEANLSSGGGNSRFKSVPDVSESQRGFLITSTSFNEIKCYIEMRHIFEEYYEEIYKQDKPLDANEGASNIKSETSVEDDIEAELKELRIERPFKQVKTQCKQVVFLTITPNFPDIDPIIIVDKFFDDIAEKQHVKCFKTFKIYPIVDTFRCSAACAKEAIANYLLKHFPSDTDKGGSYTPLKYFIEFQSRGNFKLNIEDKQKIITGVAEKVSELKPTWTVDRQNSDLIISLTALKSVCCLSILKKYFDRCKYNVVEFSKKIGINVVDVDDKTIEGDKEQC